MDKLDKLIEATKKLTELLEQLDKLVVKIISNVGWVLILIEILT